VPIRVGVQVQPQHADFTAMRRAWRDAEELGADTIYSWDHFYPLNGDPDGQHFEGVVSLAALAASTERARVGSLVFCNTYRNPQLLADVHRTIDHLSGGRVIFGIGAGWFERDYDEYGYEFGTAPDRLRALGRDLPLMKERLRKLNPPPVGPMPFLIGGGGEKVTLKLVAQHADMWHHFNDLETYHRKAAILAEHCASVGRDPATIEHTFGSMDGTLDIADDLAAAGVAEITLRVSGPDYDLGEVREAIQWRDRHNATEAK
jgi:probable F420-dependent oxidoreductase